MADKLNDESSFLPLEQNKINYTEEGVGKYSLVFDLGDNKVIKLLKPESLFADEEYKGNEVDETNKQSQLELFQKTAVEMNTNARLLENHLGPHFPHVSTIALIDSPRREVEKQLSIHKPNLPSLNKMSRIIALPESQLSIMSVENRVQGQNLVNLTFVELTQTLNDPEYQREAQDLSNRLLNLLFTQGITVDICDAKGIRTQNAAFIHSNDQVVDEQPGVIKIYDINRTWNASLGNKSPLIARQIPLPKNVYWDKDTSSLTYIDKYPLMKTNMSPQTIKEMWNWLNLKSSSGREISKEHAIELIENTVAYENSFDGQKAISIPREVDDAADRYHVFQYLALLKSMGGQLPQIED